MSDKESAIIVKNIHKSFKLPHEQHSGIKQRIINIFKGVKGYETQHVLNDISFEIKKGEFFGIVGRNGSGKSTLLKLLAGTYVPNSGLIKVNGSLTPFIELGVGFNPELTGRENVFLNGALLGFSKSEMESMYDSIVEFAELEKFMDQKLKNYSSGMQVRLAFSIAIKARSDILVLDEVLAVGDAAFQKKCYDYFMSLKKNNQTVVLVTHDMSAVRQYCDKAIMIEKGKILIASGSPENVAQAYQELFSETDVTNFAENTKKGIRWGNGAIRAEKPKVIVNNDKITINVNYIANENLKSPVYGFTIYNGAGDSIVESNTIRLKKSTEGLSKNEEYSVEWNMPNIFSTGSYTVSVACCDKSYAIFYDWLNDTAFSVTKLTNTAALVDPKIVVESKKIKTENKYANS